MSEALLTDAQFGVLVTLASAAGAATLGFGRWAVKLIAEATKGALEIIKEFAKSNTAVAVEMASMKEVLRSASDNTQVVRDKIHEDSGVHAAVDQDTVPTPPAGKLRRVPTEPSEGGGGYSLHKRRGE